MPAHIFLQLGMWPEAAASNESAWAVSDAWVKKKGLSLGARDYHSLHWLEYVYLQQGRNAKAEELLTMKRTDVAQSRNDPGIIRYNEDMAAAFVVETERWELVTKLFGSGGEAAGDGMAGHAMHDAAPSTATVRSRKSQALPIFIRGLAAAKNGSSEGVQYSAQLQALTKQLSDGGEAYAAKSTEIMQLEVAAVLGAAKGNYDEAIALMKRATAIEEEMSPPSGPPGLIKPSHELFGEILLGAKRPKEAAQQFEVSLLRQPNRAHSLLGAARAAAQSGDTKAALEAYSKLVRQLNQADPNMPGLREAQDYLKQASASKAL
jgi:tetratricopeptide (TPR) repeat protein